RCLHDDVADPGAARVEDVVEALLQEGGGLLDAALDDRHRSRVEVAGDEPGHHGRGGGGEFGRLAGDGVAGSDGRSHRQQQELDRIVPRGHDERDAQGLGEDLRPGGLQDDGHVDVVGAHPGIEVADHVGELPLHEAHLRPPARGGGLGPGSPVFGQNAMARSAWAQRVRAGSTPRLAETAEPSTTWMPSWPYARCQGSTTPVAGESPITAPPMMWAVMGMLATSL